jgi:hypothetical protein
MDPPSTPAASGPLRRLRASKTSTSPFRSPSRHSPYARPSATNGHLPQSHSESSFDEIERGVRRRNEKNARQEGDKGFLGSLVKRGLGWLGGGNKDKTAATDQLPTVNGDLDQKTIIPRSQTLPSLEASNSIFPTPSKPSVYLHQPPAIPAPLSRAASPTNSTNGRLRTSHSTLNLRPSVPSVLRPQSRAGSVSQRSPSPHRALPRLGSRPLPSNASSVFKAPRSPRLHGSPLRASPALPLGSLSLRSPSPFARAGSSLSVSKRTFRNRDSPPPETTNGDITPPRPRKKQMVWDPVLGFVTQEEVERKAKESRPVPRNEAERILNVLEGLKDPLGDGRAPRRVSSPPSLLFGIFLSGHVLNLLPFCFQVAATSQRAFAVNVQGQYSASSYLDSHFAICSSAAALWREQSSGFSERYSQTAGTGFQAATGCRL